MYTKDKSQRITLRLNEEQFNFVRMNAEVLGVSPSDFLRMVINSTLASYKSRKGLDLERMEAEDEYLEGRCGRENDKTDFDNKF